MSQLRNKQAYKDAVADALFAMPIGNCGVKYNCLVWRISEHRWQVGFNGIRHDNEAMTITEAVRYISYQ